MTTTNTGIVLCYHGCNKSIGLKAIAEGRHLSFSRHEYDWLGHGIYFWENDSMRALEWAKIHHKDPIVIGAAIDLKQCLDLAKVEYLDLLKEAYGYFREAYEKSGIIDALPKNQEGFEGDKDLVKRNLDCAVINYFHESRVEEGLFPFDSVRSPFLEGVPLYEGSKIMRRTHIQICIRNPKCILGYFRPI